MNQLLSHRGHRARLYNRRRLRLTWMTYPRGPQSQGTSCPSGTKIGGTSLAQLQRRPQKMARQRHLQRSPPMSPTILSFQIRKHRPLWKSLSRTIVHAVAPPGKSPPVHIRPVRNACGVAGSCQTSRKMAEPRTTELQGPARGVVLTPIYLRETTTTLTKMFSDDEDWLEHQLTEDIRSRPHCNQGQQK